MAFSFFLITTILLLIYLWTLLETVSFSVKVQDGECTAFLGERTSRVACPDLEGGEFGVYLTSTSLDQKHRNRPLDLLAPGPAWQEIAVTV